MESCNATLLYSKNPVELSTKLFVFIGVYVQCEALSLTRDIPFGLAWLIKPLVTRIPKQSLNRALGRTREVVVDKMKKASATTPTADFTDHTDSH